jgi:D-alanyl-D-alanine carboxypeptidase
MKTFESIMASYQKKVPTLQVQITSDDLGINDHYSSTELNQKYHSASVGKVAAAVMVMKACENHLIKLDEPIVRFFEPGFLDQLFVYQGKDYQNEVTMYHLLTHTSGVNDYFEGKLKGRKSFLSTLMEHKDDFYEPRELINLTRKHQQAISKPGQKYKYSDTGFLLIGLLLEHLYQMPLHEIYQVHLFTPLKMNDTTLIGYSPKYDAQLMAPLMFKGRDIHTYRVLSFDFSGGGLCTTTQDLTLFLKALFNGKIISHDALKEMQTFKHVFHVGLYYGLGMIEVRFSKLFFLLKGYPNLQGGLGVSAAHAWIDPVTKDTYVINMGDLKRMSLSFRLLIDLVTYIKRMREESK